VKTLRFITRRAQRWAREAGVLMANQDSFRADTEAVKRLGQRLAQEQGFVEWLDFAIVD
jgi:hypothetical protein